MKKEYSDLPKNEKHNFQLDILFLVCITLLVFAIIMIPITYLYVAQGDPSNIMISSLDEKTTKEETIKHYTEWINGALGLEHWLIVFAMINVIVFSIVISEIIKHHFKLYTQIDLEKAERKVTRIKDAL